MSKADEIFWRQFGIILGALILFAIIVFFIARVIAGDAFQAAIGAPSAVAARIAPVGSVRVGDPSKTVAAAAPAPAMAAAPAPAAGGGGESVYNSACAACHAAGVAGAPKLDDEAAWAPRLGQGLDALVASVINGKGAMPPKAGNPSLDETQIRAAVDYMVATVSGEGAGTAGAAAAAAQVVERAVQGASEAAGSMASAAGQAVEKVADAVSAAAGQAAGGEAAGQPGDAIYNKGCVACHATGAANAPKLDDKAAWETRAAAGLDAMVGNVLNGKGAMPPKGGLPGLTEPDARNAVRYMLEQAGVAAGGG